MSLPSLLSKTKEVQGDAHIAKTLSTYFKNIGVSPDVGMAGVQKEVSQGLKLIPFESSVMGVKVLGNGVAQIHFFTIGTAKDLIDDMQYFVKHLKDNGIRVIYDTMPNPLTTEGLQKLGAKVMPSDNPKYKFKAQL